MSKIFLHLLNISITAGWIVLVVVLLRFVLKKAPKWIRVVLWGLVALRLLLPITIESVTSLVPSAETVKIEPMTASVLSSVNVSNYSSYLLKDVPGEQIVLQSGFPMLNSAVNPTPAEAAKHFDTVSVLKAIAGTVWLAGVVGMLFYVLISFLRLRHRVRASVKLEKGVYVCDEIRDSFILGLIFPKIYLPSCMEETTRVYVLSHERAHLKRCDHVWKPLGFLLLSVYWFNPLLWLAYILLCRDIELACDEKVIKELSDEGKAAYSEALVNASVSRRTIAACPLAFGETGVKSRVKSVLNYKKPAFWIILIAILACVAVAVCFLTMPKKDKAPETAPELTPLPTSSHEAVNMSFVKVLQWLDYYESSGNMPWDSTKEITLDAFPNVTFRWTSGSVEAVENGRTRTLFTGMPVWSVFFTDLTSDGKPELYATVSSGSGIIDEHVIVYDYANKQSYTLWDRMQFDFHLYMVDDALYVGKMPYNGDKQVDYGVLEMRDGIPSYCSQSNGSYTPLCPELRESELYGEWLVEEEKDNDGNVLYSNDLTLWKEYNFKPDGTVVYNETIPISSVYEEAFGHPVSCSYEVHDDFVYIAGDDTSGAFRWGGYDRETGRLKLMYNTPERTVYATLKRMGTDFPETGMEATPEPDFSTTSPFDQSQYHKTVPVGEVPEAFREIVAQNLFYQAIAGKERLLTKQTIATSSYLYTYQYTLRDRYGNLLAEVDVPIDSYSFRSGPAVIASDGGFLVTIVFEDHYLSDEQRWASEKEDVISYILKYDAEGNLQWKTELKEVEGDALRLCIEQNGAYYFFGDLETPETKHLGVGSYTDLYLLKIGTDGSILKEQTYGGSDFDMIWTVDTDRDCFVIDARIQSTDGDFPAFSAWRITVDSDLAIVKKEQIENARNASYVGTVDGRRSYDDDPRFNSYPDGHVRAILDYGTFDLIVSENATGVYENQPPVINSIWCLTETVYAAYDKQNNLLWKAAVDSSPDYDSMVKRYTYEP